MASAGFVRYTGYDNADIFKNMLIEAYAAAKKNGLFFEGKIPMASTAEVSAAANYAAGDFSDVKSVKAGLQSWLSTQRIECDAGAMAEALTEASRNCGANGRNTYLVIFCWLMKYLAVRPQSLVLIGAASLRELYFLHIMNLAGVRIVYVSYGMDKDFDKFPHANRVQNMTGSMSGMIQMDFSHIDLSKAAQMSQMRASAQQVENTVQRLSTTAAGIFEDFMTEHRTRVVKNGGVFREGGVIPVYFAALIGYDEEAVYNNMLLKFKEGFAGSKKQLIFIEKPMENPTAEEIRHLNFLYMNTAAAWNLSNMQVLIHKSMYEYYKNQSHHPTPYLQIQYSLLFYTRFQKTSVSYPSDTDGYKVQTISNCQCFLHLLLPVPE